MLVCRAHPQYRRNVQGQGVMAPVRTRMFAAISYDSETSLILAKKSLFAPGKNADLQ
jgi:hypothetical protein